MADQAPNAPYTNWSETNRSNMFTPIDANNFYFPGPIQKAVNYGFDRYLNVSPANVNTANNNFAPDDPARSAFLQSRRGTARHPLIIVHPRFDATLDGNGLPTVPNFDVNDPTLVFNANGAYYESPVLFYPGKIQGSGPGGIYAPPVGSTDPLPVFGSVVDGQYFNAATNKPEPTTSDQADGTDPFTYDPSLFAEPYAALWENFVVFQLGQGATPADPTIPQPLTPLASWYGYGWDGQQAPTEGEVLYVVAHEDDYTSSYKAAIDGLTITGGDQKGFPGNRNEVGGGRIANAPGETGTAPDENFVLDIQGGAIMVNAFARYLQLTNNSVIANSGASGAIRIGTPQLGTDTEDGNPETDPATGETFPTFDQENTNVRLAFNRITANGGTSLGGALAIFNGSHNYRVDHNEFCGNFSAEYGGAISHFGLSKNGEIDHNKVYLNESVDEGAGVMIAGEPHLDPAVAIPIPNKLSNGSGPVTIHDNYIASNLAGDDGGGIRFLQSGTWQADVYNNMITDNVSTHEGGGIALDDATNVRIVNDSIAKNLTTATAVTSLGAPAPAGLSTGDNSSPLMACSVDNLNDALGHNRHGTGGQIRTGNFVFTRNGFFTQDDVGATLVANFVPAGAQIVSVSANGNSATLSVAATGSGNQNHPNLAFDVYRDCSGMPPQPTGASPFANPLIFNDIFEDNRAGNWQTTGTNYGVNGIGLFTDEAIYHWDMGLADGPGTLSPHYSIINDDDGNGFTDDGTNQLHNELIGGPTHVPYVSDAQFQSPFDIKVSVSPWRVNPRFRPTSILGVSLPANAIGDYHIVRGSPAQDAGVTQYPPLPATAVATAPTSDIDADGRSNPDEGADEIPPPSADLSITKTDNVTDVTPGQALTYTVVVTDNGPDAVTAAPVTDTFPAGLTVSSWTCIATRGVELHDRRFGQQPHRYRVVAQRWLGDVHGERHREHHDATGHDPGAVVHRNAAAGQLQPQQRQQPQQRRSLGRVVERAGDSRGGGNPGQQQPGQRRRHQQPGDLQRFAQQRPELRRQASRGTHVRQRTADRNRVDPEGDRRERGAAVHAAVVGVSTEQHDPGRVQLEPAVTGEHCVGGCAGGHDRHEHRQQQRNRQRHAERQPDQRGEHDERWQQLHVTRLVPGDVGDRRRVDRPGLGARHPGEHDPRRRVEDHWCDHHLSRSGVVRLVDVRRYRPGRHADAARRKSRRLQGRDDLVSTERSDHSQTTDAKDDRRPEMDNYTESRIGRRSFLRLAAGGVALGAAGTSAVVHFTRSSPAARPART